MAFFGINLKKGHIEQEYGIHWKKDKGFYIYSRILIIISIIIILGVGPMPSQVKCIGGNTLVFKI